MVIQLHCHVLWNKYLCGAEGGQIQLGPSGYSHRHFCIFKERWPLSNSHGSGKSWWRWWYPPLHVLQVSSHHPWTNSIFRSRSLLWSDGVCGIVAWSSWGSGSSPSNTASSMGIREDTDSSPAIPVIPLHQGLKASLEVLDQATEDARGSPWMLSMPLQGPHQSHQLIPYHPDGPGIWKVREEGNLGVPSWPG